MSRPLCEAHEQVEGALKVLRAFPADLEAGQKLHKLFRVLGNCVLH